MTEQLTAKPRYEILDGLRGVAALIVVAFHMFETYSQGPAYQILNHGYLAVDFFFLLSGFVIGYAYDDRWEKMSLGAFFKRRLIRLHPMYIIGTAIGLLLFYFGGDHPDFPLVNQTPWWEALLVSIFCMTMLPLPASMDIRGWQEFNPLNGTTWTLLWEYFANLLYALVFRRLSKLLLGILMGIGAALTFVLCMDIDVFGVLSGVREPQINTVIGGWSTQPDQLQIGFTRLFFPFVCGIFLFRFGKKISISRGGFWICAAIIAAIQVMPRIGGTCPENFWMNGIYEFVSIVVIFPLVIMMGAGSKISCQLTTKICKFLGDISYPIYVTHYPLVYMQMSWKTTHADLPASTHAMVGIMLYIIAIAVAYGTFKLIDMPARKWLSNIKK